MKRAAIIAAIAWAVPALGCAFNPATNARPSDGGPPGARDAAAVSGDAAEKDAAPAASDAGAGAEDGGALSLDAAEDSGGAGAADAADGGPIMPDGSTDAAPADARAQTDASTAADANTPDAAAGDACTAWPFNVSNIDPCAQAIPKATVALDLTSRYVFDTSSSTIADTVNGITLPVTSSVAVQNGATPLAVRVLHASQLVIESGAVLTVTGPYPLILLVEGPVQLNGTLYLENGFDVGCPSANVTGQQGGIDGMGKNAGGGGGGGGAFSGKGGDGGDGHMGMLGKGAMGMMMNGAAMIAPLRGGCSGGSGGAYPGVVPGGLGGGGGGAVQISARTSITISGIIDASGYGGQRGFEPTLGDQASGGGGGGSGGAVSLEAVDITVQSSASLCANGGSGGEGGSADSLIAPSDGTAALCAVQAAVTPQTSAGGGAGGAGGYGTMRAGVNGGNGMSPGIGLDASGGGGGGGSAGRIRIHAVNHPTIDSQVITPPAM